MLIKNRQLIFLIVVLVMGGKTIQAQDTLRLSLKDARRMALDKNTIIRNSEIDIKIAEKKIWETTAIGLPHLDAKAAYTYLPVVPSFPASGLGGGDSGGSGSGGDQVIALGVKNSVTFDFTVSQLIFNGAYIIGLQASKAYHNLSKENLEKTMLDVNEAVNNTYYMILLAEESYKILNQNLKNVEQTLYEITEMNKQGFVEKTDVDQLEVTANTIRNALKQIESNRDMSYRLLKIELNVDESTNVAVTDSIGSGKDLTAASQELINQPFILDQNTDYKILKSSELLAELDYKREKSNSLPVIAGFFNRHEIWNSPIFNFTPKSVFGINMSLPIFSSGQRSSAVFQKKLSLDKATNSKIYFANNTYMQAIQYRNDLSVKLDKYQIQKRNKDLSDEIYQRTLEKYKQGISTSIDLMNTQNQYLTNLTNYYQSVFDLEGAKSKLEKLYNINQDIKN
jgi:outer membrane protein